MQLVAEQLMLYTLGIYTIISKVPLDPMVYIL
jgi:hypothetical protein